MRTWEDIDGQACPRAGNWRGRDHEAGITYAQPIRHRTQAGRLLRELDGGIITNIGTSRQRTKTLDVSLMSTAQTTLVRKTFGKAGFGCVTDDDLRRLMPCRAGLQSGFDLPARHGSLCNTLTRVDPAEKSLPVSLPDRRI
jgi:hypothetical protein